MSILPSLHAVVDGQDLSEAEAEDDHGRHARGRVHAAPDRRFSDRAAHEGRDRRRTDRLRARHARFATPFAHRPAGGEPLLDTCGTGGDGPPPSTSRPSRRSSWRRRGARREARQPFHLQPCGSADVLEALGVRIDLSPDVAARAIREVGIGFLFAPAFHTATRHVQPVRLELKMRTAFNFLGPLTNPAGASVQLVGTTSEHNAGLIAGRSPASDSTRLRGAWTDGLDEVTTTTETVAFEIHQAQVTRRILTPEDFGVPRAHLDQLAGGLAPENAEIARCVLAGESGPARDIVIANAALALLAAEKISELKEGVRLAAEVIDSGAALDKVTRLAKF